MNPSFGKKRQRTNVTAARAASSARDVSIGRIGRVAVPEVMTQNDLAIIQGKVLGTHWPDVQDLLGRIQASSSGIGTDIDPNITAILVERISQLRNVTLDATKSAGTAKGNPKTQTQVATVHQQNSVFLSTISVSLPHIFSQEPLLMALIQCLKASPARFVSLLVVSILNRALDPVENWPAELCVAYALDSLGPKRWVDHSSAQSFSNNILSVVRSHPENVAVKHQESSPTPDRFSSPNARDHAMNVMLQVISGTEAGTGVHMSANSVSDSGSSAVTIPRRSESSGSVGGVSQSANTSTTQGQNTKGSAAATAVATTIENRMGPAMRLLSKLTGHPAARVSAAKHLEVWASSTRFAREAGDLMAALAADTHGTSEADIYAIKALTRVRMRRLLPQFTHTAKTKLGGSANANASNPNDDPAVEVLTHNPEYPRIVLQVLLFGDEQGLAQSMGVGQGHGHGQRMGAAVQGASANKLLVEVCRMLNKQHPESDVAAVLHDAALNTTYSQIPSLVKRLSRAAAAAGVRLALVPLIAKLLNPPADGHAVFNAGLDGVSRWLRCIVEVVATMIAQSVPRDIATQNQNHTQTQTQAQRRAHDQISLMLATVHSRAVDWCKNVLWRVWNGSNISGAAAMPGFKKMVLGRMLLLEKNGEQSQSQSQSQAQVQMQSEQAQEESRAKSAPLKLHIVDLIGNIALMGDPGSVSVEEWAALPFQPSDALNLLEAVLLRASKSHPIPIITLNVPTVSLESVIDSICRLARWPVPRSDELKSVSTIKVWVKVKVKDGESDVLGNSSIDEMCSSSMFWRTQLILAMIGALDPSGVVGSILWNQYPFVRELMERVITRQYRSDCVVSIRVRNPSEAEAEAEYLAREKVFREAILSSVKHNFDDTDTLLIYDPKSVYVRKPPASILNTLLEWDRVLGLGRRYCACRKPVDYFVDLLDRTGPKSAMSWVSNALTKDPGLLPLLSVNALSAILLSYKTMSIGGEGEGEGEDDTSWTDSVVDRLQRLLSTGDVQASSAALTTVTFFFDALNSTDKQTRKAARLVLQSIIPSQYASKSSWISSIMSLPCFKGSVTMARDLLREPLIEALGTETDPIAVHDYIIALALGDTGTSDVDSDEVHSVAVAVSRALSRHPKLAKASIALQQAVASVLVKVIEGEGEGGGEDIIQTGCALMAAAGALSQGLQYQITMLRSHILKRLQRSRTDDASVASILLTSQDVNTVHFALQYTTPSTILDVLVSKCCGMPMDCIEACCERLAAQWSAHTDPLKEVNSTGLVEKYGRDRMVHRLQMLMASIPNGRTHLSAVCDDLRLRMEGHEEKVSVKSVKRVIKSLSLSVTDSSDDTVPMDLEQPMTNLAKKKKKEGKGKAKALTPVKIKSVRYTCDVGSPALTSILAHSSHSSGDVQTLLRNCVDIMRRIEGDVPHSNSIQPGRLGIVSSLLSWMVPMSAVCGSEGQGSSSKRRRITAIPMYIQVHNGNDAATDLVKYLFEHRQPSEAVPWCSGMIQSHILTHYTWSTLVNIIHCALFNFNTERTSPTAVLDFIHHFIEMHYQKWNYVDQQPQRHQQQSFFDSNYRYKGGGSAAGSDALMYLFSSRDLCAMFDLVMEEAKHSHVGVEVNSRLAMLVEAAMQSKENMVTLQSLVCSSEGGGGTGIIQTLLFALPHLFKQAKVKIEVKVEVSPDSSMATPTSRLDSIASRATLALLAKNTSDQARARLHRITRQFSTHPTIAHTLLSLIGELLRGGDAFAVSDFVAADWPRVYIDSLLVLSTIPVQSIVECEYTFTLIETLLMRFMSVQDSTVHVMLDLCDGIARFLCIVVEYINILRKGKCDMCASAKLYTLYTTVLSADMMDHFVQLMPNKRSVSRLNEMLYGEGDGGSEKEKVKLSESMIFEELASASQMKRSAASMHILQYCLYGNEMSVDTLTHLCQHLSRCLQSSVRAVRVNALALVPEVTVAFGGEWSYRLVSDVLKLLPEPESVKVLIKIVETLIL